MPQPLIDQPLPDGAGRPLATWRVGAVASWFLLLAVGIGGTVLTAAGSAWGQLRGLDPISSNLVLAGCVAASALAGIGLMRLTRRPLPEYGFRRPARLRTIHWALPLLALPVVVWITTPPAVPPASALAYGILALAVGCNEETWFRGLAPAALRRFGHKTSILGAAGIFGLLHLSNALAGQPPAYLALQVALAFLAGLVLCEVVAITGSLWVGIGWHALYDFSGYLGGDSLTPLGLVGVGVMDAILVAYGAVLWRRLP